jgi:hypothetical protein
VPDVTEKPEEIAREAERGRSERTPWLVLGGVQIVIGLVVVVVLALVFLVYFLS